MRADREPLLVAVRRMPVSLRSMMRTAVVIGLLAGLSSCGTSDDAVPGFTPVSTSVVPAGGFPTDPSPTSSDTPGQRSLERPDEAGWTRLPSPPLSGRVGSVVADLDGRLFVGGGWDHLCPPGADCGLPDTPRFADGAIYDFGSGTWTSIADAPVGYWQSPAAVSGDDLSLMTTCEDSTACTGFAVLRYRGADDEWDVLPAPAFEQAWPNLVTLDDGTVVAVSESDEWGVVPDHRWVAVDEEWVALPDDPLPATYDRFAFGHEGKLYVFGSALGGDRDSKLGAVFDPSTGTWTELAGSGTLGYQVWLGDDGFYLNPHFGSSAGGGVFDPGTDAWSAFPDPPDADSWRNDLAGLLTRRGAVYEYSSGWVWDSDAGEWIEIEPRPDSDGVSEGRVAAVGRRLVVFGGQRWSADGGELLNETWVWSP